ncbi:MAG: dTMP kinase [Deltaproteobacteria bacterium]|nr:dTMP kinase [Deltaproteobacteria bacterium]
MLRFVTIEGGDGSGKSRQLGLLDEYLDSRGVSRLLTREPGDTPLGKQLRKLVLEGRPESLSDETELFLILADRAQHVHEVVRPAIEQGKLVMSDRFVDSTLAYQGYGRGMDLALLRRLNLVATGGTMPELTIILDCPVEVALARAAERQDRQDRQASRENRFEAEGVAFQRRVREGFLELAGAEPSRCVVVQSDGPVMATQEKLRRIIDERLHVGARR